MAKTKLVLKALGIVFMLILIFLVAAQPSLSNKKFQRKRVKYVQIESSSFNVGVDPYNTHGVPFSKKQG